MDHPMTTAAAIFAILSSLGLMAWAVQLLGKARNLFQIVEDFADRTGEALERLEDEARGVLPAEKAE